MSLMTATGKAQGSALPGQTVKEHFKNLILLFSIISLIVLISGLTAYFAPEPDDRIEWDVGKQIRA